MWTVWVSVLWGGAAGMTVSLLFAGRPLLLVWAFVPIAVYFLSAVIRNARARK